MKRPVFILIALLMVAAVMFPSCAKQAPAPAETPPPTTEQPQYGGILRCAFPTGPRVLGYFPEMGFTDIASLGVHAEGLTNVDGKGNLIPELATSWDVDKANKTITWHLRQGVKFHDGTDWNAEAAKWTYDKTIEAGKLQYGELITSIEVIDDYTLRFNLTQYNNRLVQAYGYGVYFFSPTAFETNGKEWARTHPVGTGAFKVVDFKRDDYMKLERNENYWRPGRPYLDGMNIRFIQQEMTASTSLQAGEVDYWQGPGELSKVSELQEKGLKVVVGRLIWLLFLMPDAKNPDSTFANKKVREAVDYALDREGLMKTLTLGLGEPAYQVAPSNAAVYDPDYKGRPYDPEKAKQLLAEAGYPNGFQTTIYVVQFQDTVRIATAIQGCLADVGIEAKIEVSDMGRFMVMEEEGWNNGLMLNIVSLATNYVVDFLNNFGPLPTKYSFASFGRTPEYEALCQQVQSAQDDKSEREIVQKMIKQLGEDAIVIPLFGSPACITVQPYVHFYTYPETGMPAFWYREWWMEKY